MRVVLLKTGMLILKLLQSLKQYLEILVKTVKTTNIPFSQSHVDKTHRKELSAVRKRTLMSFRGQFSSENFQVSIICLIKIGMLTSFSAKGEETFHCGGSLINDRYIITGKIYIISIFRHVLVCSIVSAAHCVKDFKAKDLEVRLGEWNTLTQNVNAEPVIDMKVTESIPHEDYRGGKTKFNDIALLRLRASVVFTNFVNPICLPFNSLHNEPDFTNKTFDVTGWGKL